MKIQKIMTGWIYSLLNGRGLTGRDVKTLWCDGDGAIKTQQVLEAKADLNSEMQYLLPAPTSNCDGSTPDHPSPLLGKRVWVPGDGTGTGTGTGTRE